MTIVQEDIIKLLIAIALGGLIGAEREFRDKAAGFRTIILITTGSTLFTIFSLKLGGEEDPVRIAASIVSGVGFLGAGTIMRAGKQVTGLTTAATIWLAAALGMGVGGGYYQFAAAVTGAVLVVLWIFPFIEVVIDTAREQRSYEITFAIDADKFKQIEALIAGHRLQIRRQQRNKQNSDMICTWDVYGKLKNHERFVEAVFSDDAIKEFRF